MSLRNIHGAATPAVKQPATPTLLHLLSKAIDSNSHDDRVFFAACCLATYACLRGCEFLYSRKYPKKSLIRGRWTFDSHGATLHLHDTKTSKSTVITVHLAPHPQPDDTCPVLVVRTMLALSPFPADPNDLLFRLSDGKPLTFPLLQAWVEAHISKLGALGVDALIPDARVRSSSWRAGGAKGAVQARVHTKTLNVVGHWAENSRHAEFTYNQVFLRDVDKARADMSSTGLALANAAREAASKPPSASLRRIAAPRRSPKRRRSVGSPSRFSGGRSDLPSAPTIDSTVTRSGRTSKPSARRLSAMG